MLEFVIALIEKIIAWLKGLFGEDEPVPPDPEKGPYFWIVVKYGEQQPAYFPDNKYNNQKALWKVKEGVIDHKVFHPNILKNGKIETNPKGGIIFSKAITDVTVSAGQELIGFRKILAAGTQADGGKGIELVDPVGSVIPYEIVDYLGYIDEEGYLVK